MLNHKWSFLLLLGTTVLSAAQESSGQCTYGPGYYCGASIGKEADHLYYCENGIWSDKETCQYGCNSNKPGYPDFCFQSLNITSPPQAFVPSQIPSAQSANSLPTPTNNIQNANIASPTSSSHILLVATPSASPASHQNMTLVWEEAIDTFIRQVTSKTSHGNEHSDAVLSNMRGIIGLPRDLYGETT